jgi:Fe-Mn family superoxide dismutase
MAFELPTLPYSTSALAAKKMCQETLELHHGKHHNAYVTASSKRIRRCKANRSRTS